MVNIITIYRFQSFNKNKLLIVTIIQAIRMFKLINQIIKNSSNNLQFNKITKLKNILRENKKFKINFNKFKKDIPILLKKKFKLDFPQKMQN